MKGKKRRIDYYCVYIVYVFLYFVFIKPKFYYLYFALNTPPLIHRIISIVFWLLHQYSVYLKFEVGLLDSLFFYLSFSLFFLCFARSFSLPSISPFSIFRCTFTSTFRILSWMYFFCLIFIQSIALPRLYLESFSAFTFFSVDSIYLTFYWRHSLVFLMLV